MNADRCPICPPNDAIPDCPAHNSRHGQRMVLAMAYVLPQELNTLYDPLKGFDRGTLFPELDLPFLAGGCCG